MDRVQVRAARALLGWSQDDLARASGVSVATIRRLEPGAGNVEANQDTISKIAQALEDAGVHFFDSNEAETASGIGVVLKSRSDEDQIYFVNKNLEEAQAAVRACLPYVKGSEVEGNVKELLEGLDAALKVMDEWLGVADEIERRKEVVTK